jgi:hypothetical protein
MGSVKRELCFEPVCIRLDDSHDKLQSHRAVSLTACTNNALAADLRFPLRPTGRTLLPGPTRTARLARLQALELGSICSISKLDLNRLRTGTSPEPNWPRAQS